jgi:hypothetical protein
MATLPFPDTKLFHEALKSAEALDESEMPQYELDPPYIPPAYPTDTPGEQNYTQKMIEVFLGRQLRQRRKFEDCRLRMLNGEALREERQREFFVLFRKWEALNTYLVEYQAGPREVAMAENLLRWRAYLVYKLASEIEDC